MRTKLKLLVLFILMVSIVQGQYGFEYTKNTDFTSGSKLWSATRFTDTSETRSKFIYYALVYYIRQNA